MDYKKKDAVIFDIDGCLSDDRWRRNLIAKNDSPNRYGEYHSKMESDKHFPASLALLHAASASKKIIFITARPVLYQKETITWLKNVTGMKVEIDYKLIMRSSHDYSASPVLKSYVARQMAAAGYNIVMAYDDRDDVVSAYQNLGIQAAKLDHCGLHLVKECDKKEVNRPDAADILEKAGSTFRTRNAVYADNYKKVGAVMKALFPQGVLIETEQDHNFYHLFELMIVKLTRFVNSGLTHSDSIHDMAVYAAMCEVLVADHSIQIRSEESKSA